MIKENSPIKNVGKIKIPILLIQGSRDEVVPVEQGRTFQVAMEKEGKELIYVELKDVDHNLMNVRYENPQSDQYFLAYKSTLLIVEDFLETHLKP